MALGEGPLERMELARAADTLDRRELAALQPDREQRAALERAPVDEDGTGAALARVAADLRAGESELVAECMRKQGARLELQDAARAVDAERGFEAIDVIPLREPGEEMFERSRAIHYRAPLKGAAPSLKRGIL